MVLVLRLGHYVFRGQTLVIDMPASLAHEEIGLERFQPGVGSDDIELGEPNGVGKVGRYRAWARFVQQPPRGFVKVDDALVFQIHLSLIGLGSSSSIDEDAFGLEIYQGPVAAGGSTWASMSELLNLMNPSTTLTMIRAPVVVWPRSAISA